MSKKINKTQTRLRLNAHQVRPFSMDGASLGDLDALGIDLPARPVAALRAAWAMDAAAGPGTISLGGGVPVQFLQTLLPGAVRAVTAARRIDQIVGRTIAGRWHDEEIVQTVVELTGRPQPYGDRSPGPLANFNVGFERRSVVRFRMDMEVTILEEERSAEIRQNSGALKRSSISQALAIEHNRIGFYGYADGEGRTYGFLNDPSLPAYRTVPAGVGGAKWSQKSYEELVDDLLLAASTLRIQTQEVVDPETTVCVLALASSCREFLNVVNDHGMSVKQWLKENYPKWRIESAPELDKANGGQNIFYLYAEEVAGGEEEANQKVIEQFVPAILRLLGAERRATGPYEAYSSATAGIMVRVPFAIVRFTGI